MANASNYLFECLVVTTVLDVAEWLVDPVSPNRLRALVTSSSLGLTPLSSAFEAHDWRFDAIGEESNRIDEVTDEQRELLARLHRLREKRPVLRAQSAVSSVGDIIETLGLRADPTGAFSSVVAEQRVANLEAFVHLVTEWERNSLADLADVVGVFAPLREAPHTGPTQPLVGTDDHDVVFKTAHQAKGDESGVVALADLGWSLRKLGLTSQRLVATGPMVGLAPVVNDAAPDIDSLSVFTRGLYDRFGLTPFPGVVRLRWASERWTAAYTGYQSNADMVSHNRVQTAT